jgi:hypothetical protein
LSNRGETDEEQLISTKKRLELGSAQLGNPPPIEKTREQRPLKVCDFGGGFGTDETYYMRFRPTLSASQPLETCQVHESRWFDVNLQEKLSEYGANRRHRLDQRVVNLWNMIAMLWEITKPKHIGNQTDREDLWLESALEGKAL